MKYNVGDKVWAEVEDENGQGLYTGPATINYIFKELSGDNCRYEVRFPIEVKDSYTTYPIREDEIKYAIT
jgi:hypothetical protein